MRMLRQSVIRTVTEFRPMQSRAASALRRQAGWFAARCGLFPTRDIWLLIRDPSTMWVFGAGAWSARERPLALRGGGPS